MSHGWDIYTFVKALDGNDDPSESIEPASAFLPDLPPWPSGTASRCDLRFSESDAVTSLSCALVVTVDDPALPSLRKTRTHDFYGQVNFGRGLLDDVSPVRRRASINPGVTSRTSSPI